MVTKNTPCIMCDEEKPIAWVRCTQFAGDHYFCEECAKKESDFSESDSMKFWIDIESYINYDET